MKVQTQLITSLGLLLLVIVASIVTLNYYFVRNSLISDAQQELMEIEKSMHLSVQALLSTAIRNYLRGITEANLDIVKVHYQQFEDGILTESEAKDAIQEHFSLQQVGDSGYLVAVLEEKDEYYLDIHPFQRGRNCSETEGCQQWEIVRNGYVEYDWKNPKDNSYRKKAAYVLEFKPWNWVVGASSYRDEFVSLVQINDLREMIAPVKIKDTGYFFVFDQDYRILIHPEMEGVDGRSIKDGEVRLLFEQLMESRDGFYKYVWKNPSEIKPRLKYALTDRLEGYNWYLVASGYYSEILAPISKLKTITLAVVLLAAAALVTLIYRLSRNITHPLVILEDKVRAFYHTKRPVEWNQHSLHEIDVVGGAFSQMTEELTSSMQTLENKISELAVSEKEKEQSRELLNSIIDSMPSVIVGIDPKMRVTLWNKGAIELTGKEENEAFAKPLTEVFSGLNIPLETVSEALQNNQTLSTIFEHDEVRVSEMTVYPLLTSGIGGAVIRVDEITDRVEMEQKLRQSQKMDAVGQLAGGVAHDFNNMLSGIMGAAELLRVKGAPENQSLVQIIISAAGRASDLILKLLAFSRKENVAFEPVNVHTIIAETVEILSRSLDKKITIGTILDAENHMILGDWSQIQNGLLNIGINAGHAMPKGGELSFATKEVELSPDACEQSPFNLKAGRFLKVSIQDSGCGIANEYLSRIFEPFFTTRDQGQGTGLGLAAVYGTLVQHGGAVSVYSEVDRGTEFRLYFPLESIGDTEPIEQEYTIISGQGCILVIDDEPIVRTTACLILEGLGYETVEAANGQEGLEVYSKQKAKIDLVLLDMIMPIMDGGECFERLKRMDPVVKVIISSGFTRNADLEKFKKIGLNGFVRKPYSIIELSRVVAGALS